MASLEKSMDLSRLKVTALDNNKDRTEKRIIQPGEKIEFSLLMHEINVLTY